MYFFLPESLCHLTRVMLLLVTFLKNQLSYFVFSICCACLVSFSVLTWLLWIVFFPISHPLIPLHYLESYRFWVSGFVFGGYSRNYREQINSPVWIYSIVLPLSEKHRASKYLKPVPNLYAIVCVKSFFESKSIVIIVLSQ